MWISGEKGVGKSVLGRTIADWCRSRGCLLTTYFIRNDKDFLLGIAKTFAATFAYGISLSLPQTRPYILDAVEKDPTIFQLSIGAQFERLVVRPICECGIELSSQENFKHPPVIIIDGLDHLVDDGVRREILRVFSNNESSFFPKVLFLSREVETISGFFHPSKAVPASNIRLEDWEWEAQPSARESLFGGECTKWSDIPINGDDKTLDIDKGDIVILVMGPTGSGKSNFIDTLTRQTSPLDLRAGDSLVSCDKEVRAVRIRHEKYKDRLVLVDTPGFDDTERQDIDILGIVGTWLKRTYEAKKKLSGILYLHRITDNRVGGTPYRNLRMFAELCGEKATNMVVLVSTMWDMVESNELGESREKELQNGHWATLLNRGAVTMRFTNSEESALKIIDYLNSKNNRDAVLLQEELSDLKKSLSDTRAGMAIYSGIEAVITGPNSRTQEDQASLLARADAAAAQLGRMKIPIGKRIALLFLSKLRVAVPPVPLAGTAR